MKELFVIGAPGIRIRTVVPPHRLPKERLHFVGRREGDQHFAGGVVDKGPGVRHLAGRENRLAVPAGFYFAEVYSRKRVEAMSHGRRVLGVKATAFGTPQLRRMDALARYR